MEKKLVIAYIGFGNSVCRYHLPYVRRHKDKMKIKYIYRREEDRVGDVERETWYPDIKFVTDFNIVLNDNEVNLVVINTPDKYHEVYTRECIKHHKNVLCEKPFALTSKAAKDIYEYAKKENVVVMANQNRRYDADILTVKKVIDSGLLGEIIEIESHYDYYRPSIKENKHFGMLYGLAVHPIDQIIGLFGKPIKVNYDCRSIDNPGIADDYYDIDFYYPNGLKAIVKTSFYVKQDYPRFIVHGKKGSFLMPALGHQSAIKDKPGPISISFESYPEEKWGTLVYEDEYGNDIKQKIPTEIGDYSKIYLNLYNVIFNNGDKVVKDEEVIEVLTIIEEATKAAKEAKG